jgi:hypothetical protein
MKAEAHTIKADEADKILRKVLIDKDITTLQALKTCLHTVNLLYGFIGNKKEVYEEFVSFLQKVPGDPEGYAAQSFTLYRDFQECLLNSGKSSFLTAVSDENDDSKTEVEYS